MKTISIVKASVFTLVVQFYLIHLFSQQPSFKLINLNLVGVNTETNVQNIQRIQRYYEKAGIRINIATQKIITLDSLKVPRLSNSNYPNYLMLELIKSYQSANPKPTSNTLTLFCLPKYNSLPLIQSFAELGYAFYEKNYFDDKSILSCASGSLGVNHTPDSSLFMSDSSAIYKLRLANINYSTEYSVFKNIEETGLTAYYIWEEDENGNIQYDPNNPLLHIKRGKKENYGIKYLDPGNWFFKPFTIVMDTKICPGHISVMVVTIVGLFFFFRILKRLSKDRKWMVKISVWVLRVSSLVFSIFVIGLSFYLINLYYTKNYVIETEIQEFDESVRSSSILAKVQDKLLFENDTTPSLGSQIFRKKKDEWYLQRNMPVLIFQLNHQNELKFKEGSNALTYRNDTLIRDVQNHFIKIERINDDDEVIAERIFNYQGKEIFSTEISVEKPGKKIVLFVNGYRSPFLTSDEFSRSVMLKRILENKTEIPRTNDKINSFDIFEYWNPWDRFDERFIAKLQPHEVYYADGHHPIRTSNYGLTNIPSYISLINNLGDLSYFYFAASNYPGVCSDLNKHSCKYVTLPNIGVKNTWELLPSYINYSGFNERRTSGVIAGKNLAQLMNRDNTSIQPKDTLFIICHSMGFAYAQGIIESLRGKINFGGYYIFSPENPSAGRVNPLEWDEVWQYGSNENIDECLQDGIAPQKAIKGLEKNRVFFPRSIYPKLGYTGSHFIGNFTWIFDLDNTQDGHIRPH